MTDLQPLDQLELFGLREDPDLWEALIVEEGQRAQHDPMAKAVLESVYWEPDRDSAFSRFRDSLEFSTLVRLFEILSVRKHEPLVEIGGGSGFLAHGLAQTGFADVTLVEPNRHFTTGTGYLCERSDSRDIDVVNCLTDWYESPNTYATVVTRNCVHHFQNITWVAACIRQKMAVNGTWIMVREPFVESARELYLFLQSHPYSQRYGVYEFGFPPSHFVQSVELAGFQLRACVPARYANDCLSLYQPQVGSRVNRWYTSMVDLLLQHTPATTAVAFRWEQFWRPWRFLRRAWFSRPQVMVFQRTELGLLPPNTIWYPRGQKSHRRAA